VGDRRKEPRGERGGLVLGERGERAEAPAVAKRALGDSKNGAFV
jgi:hypothetical protein